MQILLKYLLLIEPDRQRLSRFALYAVETLGGNLFSATLSLDKCMKALYEAVHSSDEAIEAIISLRGDQIFLDLGSSTYLISSLMAMPSVEKTQQVVTRLKQESELADPEVLRKRNARISEDLERAKIEAAREMQELEGELERRRVELEQVRSNAEKDSLTGLYNHGYYDHHLEKAMVRCKRQSEALCLLMLDVDKFKEINDNHGHIFGDEYLKRVANSMLKACRNDVDYCCRLGGDEFAIIIFSDVKQSERVAKNILKSMDMNVSIGIAQMLLGDTVKTFAERCDQALYKAKEKGRGQFVISNVRSVGKTRSR